MLCTNIYAETQNTFSVPQGHLHVVSDRASRTNVTATGRGVPGVSSFPGPENVHLSAEEMEGSFVWGSKT